jgi:hypothetical protein
MYVSRIRPSDIFGIRINFRGCESSEIYFGNNHRMRGQPITKPLPVPKGTRERERETRTYIRDSSGIRNHDSRLLGVQNYMPKYPMI